MMNGAGSVSYREQTRSAGCIPVMELLGDDEPRRGGVMHIVDDERPLYKPLADTFEEVSEAGLGLSAGLPLKLKLATCKCPIPLRNWYHEGVCQRCHQVIGVRDVVAEEHARKMYAEIEDHTRKTRISRLSRHITDITRLLAKASDDLKAVIAGDRP